MRILDISIFYTIEDFSSRKQDVEKLTGAIMINKDGIFEGYTITDDRKKAFICGKINDKVMSIHQLVNGNHYNFLTDTKSSFANNGYFGRYESYNDISYIGDCVIVISNFHNNEQTEIKRINATKKNMSMADIEAYSRLLTDQEFLPSNNLKQYLKSNKE